MKLSAEQQIKEIYPKSDCTENIDNPGEFEIWCRVEDETDFYEVMGAGNTPKQAWEDALPEVLRYSKERK